MNRFHQLLIVSAISVMALAGCNNAESPNTSATPATTDVSQATTNPTTSGKSDFDGLKNVVTQTTLAVEAGNFAKAKAEFGKFEDFWSKVEDGVKSKSPNAYKAIEDDEDAIKAALKTSAPKKDKVLATLKSLEKSISTVAKS